jgi:hypothetical protein
MRKFRHEFFPLRAGNKTEQIEFRAFSYFFSSEGDAFVSVGFSNYQRALCVKPLGHGQAE